ncbi:MAG: type II toxin-antitoxin system VapC family toxin [Deltaproteobacteria bacterium]|nr:type II toxin-antitoxin system VapC family toxin [Deltaproteobacteria bacterium]
MSAYVFDSHALLAFFQGEPGSDIVEGILRQSYSEAVHDRMICLINLGEIIYLTKRRFGDEKKIEVLSRIYQLGFKILSIPDSIVFQAAELKAQYTLSYADCFALACSINHSAVLVTGDPEFKTVAHLVAIEWIR